MKFTGHRSGLTINRGMITCGLMVSGLAMMSSAAPGQDSFEVTGANADAMFEPVGPPPLPGHDKGERVKSDEPEDKSPARVSSEWFGGDPWMNWSRATGDWGGARLDLEESGLIIEGVYIFEWASVSSGGVRNTSSSRHLRDLNLTLDLETIWNLQKATLFMDFYSTDGDSVSVDAGDFQGLSNIEVDPDVNEIAELWYEQWLMDDLLRLKVGKVDANSEFAFVDAAGEFINSSAGFSPTIFALPTYPDPAMSVNLFYYPTDQMYFGFGFYDGATAVDGVATGRRGPSTFFSADSSDDYFYIGEFGISWDDLHGMGPGRFAAGVWHHTGNHPRFDGTTQSGTEGFFALAEQRLWAPDADSERGLWGFAQFGFADAHVSAAKQHYAGGVFLQGPFAEREDDAAGVYVSHVVLSSDPASGFVDDETVIELFYKVQITPFFSLKPDLQFIMTPGGAGTVNDATVITLRAELTF